jgi:hypothetical protein
MFQRANSGLSSRSRRLSKQTDSKGKAMAKTHCKARHSLFAFRGLFPNLKYSSLIGISFSMVVVLTFGSNGAQGAAFQPLPARQPAPPTTNVNVVNSISSPVPTQNVGGGAATQVGQPASKIVNATCSVEADCYTVPSGDVLVLTDLQWVGFQSLRGQGDYDFLNIQLCVPSSSGTGCGSQSYTLPAEFSSLVDGTRDFAGQVHLTTGIIVPSGQTVIGGTDSGSGTVSMQGYLVPNQ